MRTIICALPRFFRSGRVSLPYMGREGLYPDKERVTGAELCFGHVQ